MLVVFRAGSLETMQGRVGEVARQVLLVLALSRHVDLRLLSLSDLQLATEQTQMIAVLGDQLGLRVSAHLYQSRALVSEYDLDSVHVSVHPEENEQMLGLGLLFVQTSHKQHRIF